MLPSPVIVGGAVESLFARVSATNVLRRLLIDRGMRACMIGESNQMMAKDVDALWERFFPEPNVDNFLNATTGGAINDEYNVHFKGEGYARSGLELTAEMTAALLNLLALKPTDRFVDLGSSEGRVPLAAAMLTPVGRAIGIELSPARHVLALAARERLHAADEPAPPWAPVVGDFLEASVLSEALPALPEAPRDVIWCAVQARQGRKISARLLEAVHEHRRRMGGGAPTRLLLAGFALPDKSPGAHLHCAHVFVRAASSDGGSPPSTASDGEDSCATIALSDIDRVVPLFCSTTRSKNPGPRMVLEYHVHDAT